MSSKAHPSPLWVLGLITHTQLYTTRVEKYCGTSHGLSGYLKVEFRKSEKSARILRIQDSGTFLDLQNTTFKYLKMANKVSQNFFGPWLYGYL
jgi:hypothetical protein